MTANLRQAALVGGRRSAAARLLGRFPEAWRGHYHVLPSGLLGCASVPRDRHWKGQQPFCFEVNDGELFAFAGLWDGWKNASGNWIKTCSILTTTPNVVTGAVHDRMPVILDRESYDLWLDPGMQNVQVVSEFLKPYDARLMRSYPVSSRVNHVANDDEECSRPVEHAETENRLFL
jgi:putative SOS response-associated peptidase YedK